MFNVYTADPKNSDELISLFDQEEIPVRFRTLNISPKLMAFFVIHHISHEKKVKDILNLYDVKNWKRLENI